MSRLRLNPDIAGETFAEETLQRRATVSTFDRTTGAAIRLLMGARGWTAEWRPRVESADGFPADDFGDAFLCAARTEGDVAALAQLASRHRGRVVALLPKLQFETLQDVSSPLERLDLPIEPQGLFELVARWETTCAKPLSRRALDPQTIENLSALGGTSFSRQALRQFAEDAAELETALRDAYGRRDLTDFDDRLHALRSCAANVGAKNLFEICLSMRAMSASDLAENGSSALRRIDEEMAKIRGELNQLRFLD